MLNKVVLMGRLTKDVELRSTQGGVSVAGFTLAVDRDFKGQNGERETDFINCVAWRQTAEFISKYFKKGSMAALEGSIQTRSWDGSDGKKGFATEVIVNNIYFGESKKAEAPADAPEEYTAPMGTDDDLPF